MTNPIKTAITSFGMSGLVFHGPLLKVNKGFDVKIILERSKRISGQMFPEARIVRDYNDILTDQEIELVIVNTPDKFHFEMAKQALLHGKNIVVEKPVTLKSEEAEQLVKLAHEKDLMFTVFQNRRWDADFMTVRKILESNKLGRLVEFESHYDRYRTQITPGTWKEEGDEFAGVLYNLGSHMVDQAFVLFGKPVAVTAHLRVVRTAGVVTDYYDIRLDYKDFSAILKCSYLVHKPGPRYILHGEQGSFYKHGIDPQEEQLKMGKLPDSADWGTETANDYGILFYVNEGNNVTELIESVPGNYNLFYDNVFTAIRKGLPIAVQPEEAVEVLKILEACLISNREKRTVFL